MRPRAIGISLLALITGLATAAMAETINPVLIFGSVPWEFSTRTNTFSGEEGGGLVDDFFQIRGRMELRAKFDDEGNFKTGTFKYRAPDNHLLLTGNLVEPSVEVVADGDTGFNAFYRVRFGLIVHRDDLPFAVDGGDFEAYVCDPRSGCASGPTSFEDLFTTDYSSAAAPVNNYLHTWSDGEPAALRLLAVPVQAPAPGILIGLGIAILVAMWMGRLTIWRSARAPRSEDLRDRRRPSDFPHVSGHDRIR